MLHDPLFTLWDQIQILLICIGCWYCYQRGAQSGYRQACEDVVTGKIVVQKAKAPSQENDNESGEQ